MDSNEKIDRYAKWKELISEHENSGLSQIAFCKQRDLIPSKFGYYRSVIKSQDKMSINQKLFSSVQIKKSESNTSAEIKIILPNGFQCFIPVAMDVLQLKRMMEALLSC
ncbi:MAG: hypothetical protein A3F11_07275 [Gammaproteobacteria bacterium RIFCSPHIGHO2_12_FULL_37_14]|nr:MAG: hypothetical protein A3F11_07275 [Gammaproteobacteria bacterium RIFCSPHIGHO2_12_FULL_37_14]